MRPLPLINMYFLFLPHLQQRIGMTRMELQHRVCRSQILSQRFLSVHQPGGTARGGHVCLPRQGQGQRRSGSHAGVTVQEEEMLPHADHVPGPEDRLSVNGRSVVRDRASSEGPNQS